jgi:UDP:flavonoid glycosyltransferase YjiC (YdhE family)
MAASPVAGPLQGGASQASGAGGAREHPSPPFPERGLGGKSILYAWEFGAGLGHIGTFLPVARELRARGRTIHWAVVHPHQAVQLLPRDGFAWLQAPIFPEQRRDGPPLNYADILLRFGYHQAGDLLGLTIAWRELLRLTGAQIVLADHAPTAILAARTLDIPVMLFGSGFLVPPQMSPTPNLRPWISVPIERLQQADALALESMNAVLAQFGKPALGSVAELFLVAEDALLTFPELDHYAQRGPAKYWGMLPAAVASPPQWPQVSGPRVFAYLRPESAHLEATLQALSQLNAAVLIFAPGLSTSLQARYASSHLHFSPEPADLASVARQADVGVTYASLATTLSFLMAGKPVLMTPSHLEQFLGAKRVVDMGAGLLQNPEQPPAELAAMLARVLSEPVFRDNAQAFARKYANFDQAAVLGHIVRRIEEIVNVHPSEDKGTP